MRRGPGDDPQNLKPGRTTDDAVCVGAFIVRNGSVLLGRRSSHKTFAQCWDVPGGHVEAGEKPEQALRRELLEELGIKPTAWSFHSRHEAGGTRLHLYLVTRWQGRLAPRGDEHSVVEWHRLIDAARLHDLSHPTLSDILRALACAPQILRPAQAGHSEYSWCRPPSTALLRTVPRSSRR